MNEACFYHKQLYECCRIVAQSPCFGFESRELLASPLDKYKELEKQLDAGDVIRQENVVLVGEFPLVEKMLEERNAKIRKLNGEVGEEYAEDSYERMIIGGSTKLEVE